MGVFHLYIRLLSGGTVMVDKFKEQLAIQFSQDTMREYHPKKGRMVPFQDLDGNYAL